jgi:ribonuclease HI
VALRRRALRAFQKCICPAHEKAARDARARAKILILEAKKESWDKFSNTFNRFTPLSKIWSLIKCFNNKKPPTYKIPSLLINDIHYTTPLSVATEFAAHFARISSHNHFTEQIHTTLNNTLATCHFHSDNLEHYNHPFIPYELCLAISKSGNTSVGPDRLAYPFFRNLTESGLHHFLTALNRLWEDGTFPASWSHSTLIPIQKPRKPSADPASYRPISLSSCASKIFERMVNGRLRAYLENNKIISPYQNGFRPGHSTADSLVQIIDSVQRGFINDNVTVALFLDLKAAFDTVHHSALLIEIHKIGIRGRLATYLQNFLKNRTFQVRCGNTCSPSVAQEHGVPQGSPLSPTLFLIFINDVFANIDNISANLKFSLYADDLAIWITHPDELQAMNIMQLALDEIQKWCDQRGVQISPAKSATMVFSRLHNPPVTPLHLNDENIPLVSNYKYLGLTLDRRLTFNQHVADLKQRCSRRLNILRCISGREWGADRHTLLRLYMSLIRPILDYNAFLFGNISSAVEHKLETIQNNALRIITGALCTTPISNLLADLNIPALDRRREYQLMRFYTRSSSRPLQPTYKILHNFPENQATIEKQKAYPPIAMRVQRAFRDYKLPLPKIFPSFLLRTYWTDKSPDTTLLFSDNKSDLTPIEMTSMFLEFKANHENYHFLYTDGSRAEGRTGAAFVSGSVVRRFRLSDFHSVFSAELVAILFAILHIKHNRIDKAVICTDSQSSIFALSAQHNSANPVIAQIRNQLNQVTNDIKFLWIPGHAGIPGNTQADTAAKESLQLPCRNDIPCPASDFLSIIKPHFLASLQDDWDRNPHFHFHPIKPTLEYWSSTNQHSRLKEILLARLRLGHTRLTHSYLFDRCPPPICHRCDCRYTIRHFLLDCPLYANHRQPLIMYARDNRVPLTLPLLLGNQHPNLLDLLFEFLHKTRLDLSI